MPRVVYLVKTADCGSAKECSIHSLGAKVTIGVSFNGKTIGFGPIDIGSTPITPAKKI